MDTKIILNRLAKSKFRSNFKLSKKDIEYIEKKGMAVIRSHTVDFINTRLKDIRKVNDGKQTPYHGHPSFISMHATATCCRGCLEKWYHIDKNCILSDDIIEFLVNVNMEWIKTIYKRSKM